MTDKPVLQKTKSAIGKFFNSNEIPNSVNLRLNGSILALSGAGVVFVYSLGGGIDGFFKRLGVSLALALGSVMVGALLGFLFGYPRTIQGEKSESDSGGIEYRLNTNLEEISDWLTKIIIGVGLIQLHEIIKQLNAFAGTVSCGFGDELAGKAFVLGLMAYFSVSGFLLFFLWTRLRLQFEMDAADNEVANVDKNHRADSKALSLISNFLEKGETEIDEAEKQQIRSLVEPTTEWARRRIFRLAHAAVRRADRRERGIHVFQILIDVDERREHHRPHAEIAYAILSAKTLDALTAKEIERAQEYLSNAIKIMERLEHRDYEEYYLARAFCSLRKLEQIDSSDQKAIINFLDDVLKVPEEGYYIKKFREGLPTGYVLTLKKWWKTNSSIIEKFLTEYKPEAEIKNIKKRIFGVTDSKQK